MTQADETPDIEPDYRFTLANERTFLAWQRTALGLVAAGVALQQFAAAVLPGGLTAVLAVVVVLLGGLVAVLGLVGWYRTQQAMRSGQPLRPTRAIPLLGVGLALAAIVVAAGLLL